MCMPQRQDVVLIFSTSVGTNDGRFKAPIHRERGLSLMTSYNNRLPPPRCAIDLPFGCRLSR